MTQAKKNSMVDLIIVTFLVVGVFVCGYVFLPWPAPNLCLNSVDREMTEFKYAIEDSVSRMSSPPVTFHPEGSCFSSSNKSKLTIYNEKTRAVCDSVCGFATDECYILKYSSEGNDSLKRKCLNLPPYTTFVDDEVNPGCNDKNFIS